MHVDDVGLPSCSGFGCLHLIGLAPATDESFDASGTHCCLARATMLQSEYGDLGATPPISRNNVLRSTLNTARTEIANDRQNTHINHVTKLQP